MTTTSLYKTPEGEKIVMALYDQALNRWSVPYETMTINTRHGSTFVVASGDAAAPPLILLHGAGTNSAIWAMDAGIYSKQYRVYAVDLIGEAGRSAPNRPAWEGDAFAEWTEDVLDALHMERVTLVGISQGAFTALKFAVYQPERVEKLVLMCPGGVVPDRKSFLLYAIGLSLLGQWGRHRLIQMLYGKQIIPAEVEKIIALMLRHFSGRIGILPIFTDEDLRRLTMPVLLIGGTDDPMRDIPKIEARLRAFVPHLDYELIPGAGHVLNDTTTRILAFLTASAPQPVY